MKHSTCLTLLLFIFISVFSQVPEAFNYQAVVRDESGNVIAEKDVAFRISILKDSETGTPVYVEEHLAPTNRFGLATLKIGKGTQLQGIFGPGGWGIAPHFIKVEIDPEGGDSYLHIGTTQLLSVPYAFQAQTVANDSVVDDDADPVNELQSISLSGTELTLSDGGGTVSLPSSGGGDNWGSQTVESDATLDGNGTTSNPLSVVGDLTDDQTLSISGNDLSISDGNIVSLPEAEESPWQTGEGRVFLKDNEVGIGTEHPHSDLEIFNENFARVQLKSLSSDALLSIESDETAALDLRSSNGSSQFDISRGKTGEVAKIFFQTNNHVDYSLGVGSVNSNFELFGRNKIFEVKNENGNILLFNELQTNRTGSANMLPIAYGTVKADGKVEASSGNFEVSKTDNGTYEIGIEYESYKFVDYITSATPYSLGFIRATSSNGKLIIRTYSPAGNLDDMYFSFVVYKP